MQENLEVLRKEIDQTDRDLLSKVCGFVAWLGKLNDLPAKSGAEQNGEDLFIGNCLEVARCHFPRVENEFLVVFWTLIMGHCSSEKLPLLQAVNQREFRDWVLQLTASLDDRLQLALKVEACKRQDGGKIYNRDREISVINLAITKYYVSGCGPLKTKLPAHLVTSIMLTIINHCTKIELAQREAAN